MPEATPLWVPDDEKTQAIRQRARAYRALFSPGDDDAMNGPVGEVLEDLERFCSAKDTTFVPGDTHGTAQLEGRRQVWLRIQAYLELDLSDTQRLMAAEMED